MEAFGTAGSACRASATMASEVPSDASIIRVGPATGDRRPGEDIGHDKDGPSSLVQFAGESDGGS